jgi:uncharacterized protein (DUF1810 family)
MAGARSFPLDRFVEAQAPVYDQVLAELHSGRKVSHWMWFVFPQIRGLGRSDMAVRYALHGPDEAAAYLDHPVLGPRLRACTSVVNALEHVSAEGIFGPVDAMKFRSSMTLFELVSNTDSAFSRALVKYFGGVRDELTLRLAGRE